MFLCVECDIKSVLCFKYVYSYSTVTGDENTTIHHMSSNKALHHILNEK